MNLKVKAYLFLIGLLGVFILVLNITSSNLDLEQFGLALFILSVVSFFAEIYELEIIPKYSLTTGISMLIASIFIGGIPLAMWVVLISSFLAEIFIRWDNLSHRFNDFILLIAFNVGQLALSVFCAGLVFEAFGSPKPPYESLSTFLGLISTFVTYETVNTVLVSGAVSFATGKKFNYVIRFNLRNLHIHFLILGVIAVLISIVYHSSPWHIIFAILPLALAHISMRNYLRLRKNSHAAFSHIAELLAARDQYTSEHSQEVEQWAESFAQALNLADDVIENIKMGAAIHDIGKIAVPDAILNKPGPLSEEEWVIMKQHPVVGAEIIGELEIYRDVVPIVRHEHEHWDGGGYPDGLEGENIPLGARIVSIADVYSALTTERTYRPSQGKPLKYTHEEAREIMQEGMAGKVLDPELVDIFFEKVFSENQKV